MNKRYTFRQKFLGLLGASVLFLFFLYFFTFSRTLEEADKHEQLLQKIELAKEAPGKVAELTNKVAEYNSKIGRYSGGAVSSEDRLLEVLSSLLAKSGVKVIGVDVPHIATDETVTVQTSVIKLEGKFIPLLKFLKKLETAGAIGNVKSASFSLSRSQDKKTVLFLTVYLQLAQLQSDNTAANETR